MDTFPRECDEFNFEIRRATDARLPIMNPLKKALTFSLSFFLAATQTGSAQPGLAGTRGLNASEGTIIHESPEGIIDSKWMKERRQAQLDTKENFETFVDFQFKDTYLNSGITWINRVVDDAGYSYKAVHYDHGNGLAVADVDGDGHLDIYFVNQIGSNALYRNKGDATFEEKTIQGNVGLSDRVCVSASFADYNNDGLPDLFVTSVKQGNKLFKNLGNFNFEDVTETSSLGHNGHSSGAIFFDYNRDGYLDLFLTNVGEYTNNEYRKTRNDPTAEGREPGEFHFYSGHKDGFFGHLKPWRAERSILYRNNGDETFTEVSEETKLIETGWNGDAVSVDVNNDGWLDLYVTDMQGHDEYWENQNGLTFAKKTFSVFGKTPWGAMGVHAFDWDQNGFLDIYITDMHSDMSYDLPPDIEEEKTKSDIQFPESYLRSGRQSIFGNAFYQNNGGGSFTEISDDNGAENYWPWGLSVGDLNADGYEDAFVVSSMNYGFRYHPNSLLINDNGKILRDAEFILGVEPREGERTAIPWFELDVLGADKNHSISLLVLRDRPETKKISVWGALGGRSSAIVDFDNDGDLDIVTNDFHSEPTLLISNLSETNPNLNYLKIHLEGTTSNRDGLGSLVRIEVAGQTYTQLYNGKSGYLSQSIAGMYFGLGSATSVESIRVDWPSGKIQTVAGPINSNQRIHIREEPGGRKFNQVYGKSHQGTGPSGHKH